MKVKTLSALAGVGAAMIMSNGAEAAMLVIVSQNTTNTFLTANGLQSAVIGVTGFLPGENFQGMVGTAANPWMVSTSGGSFFNVGSTSSFDGMGQTAATAAVAMPGAAFDTGTLAPAAPLGGIAGDGNPFGFAQFGVGQNSGPGFPVAWLTLNAAGLAGSSFNLVRLTWSASESATFAGVIVTNTGGGSGFEYVSSITIPAVPAPGALALLGLAGLVGARRRRA